MDRDRTTEDTGRIRVHALATVSQEDAHGEDSIAAHFLIIVLAQRHEDWVQMLGKRRDCVATCLNDLCQDAYCERLLCGCAVWSLQTSLP